MGIRDILVLESSTISFPGAGVNGSSAWIKGSRAQAWGADLSPWQGLGAEGILSSPFLQEMSQQLWLSVNKKILVWKVHPVACSKECCWQQFLKVFHED